MNLKMTHIIKKLVKAIERLSYSKPLLWLRATRFQDFLWLSKAAVFYLCLLLVPSLWNLRDKLFPPERKILVLRINNNKFTFIWRDVTLLHALSEIFFHRIYNVESLRGNEVALDLGAGVGLYTLYISDKLKNGIIVAVEPEPFNRLLLQYNVKVNKLSNVVVIGRAISDRVGVAHLILAPYSVSHRIADVPVKELKAKGVGVITVPTTTIDALVEELKLDRVDIIKMDIEGAEYLALKGAIRTLKNNTNIRLVISAEHDPEIRKRCVALLKHLGFKVRLDGYMIYAYKSDLRDLAERRV